MDGIVAGARWGWRNMLKDKACSLWQAELHCESTGAIWCLCLWRCNSVWQTLKKDLAAINRLRVKEARCKYSALVWCHFTPSTPPSPLPLGLSPSLDRTLLTVSLYQSASWALEKKTWKQEESEKEKKKERKEGKTGAGSSVVMVQVTLVMYECVCVCMCVCARIPIVT